ncbi:MAG: carbamoyltransferase HypF [Spirochaetaceae bacterium]|nr:MAG: carbamoyltransferase HypF [Spirochaetaceae bacterium]
MSIDERTFVTAQRITVRGLVQGVGFRPYIYRLAENFHISGTVENANDAVYIHAEATQEQVAAFIEAIPRNKPPAAEIYDLHAEYAEPSGAQEFRIIASSDRSEAVTRVSPDIAVCADCLDDMNSQPHRIAYPLINCTNCGPRFSIIRDLPYDRPNTTMDVFPMCDTCRKEYEDVHDRRFHAQPVACTACGPVYSVWEAEGGTGAALGGTLGETTAGAAALERTATIIDDGGLVALKGTGGYHLVCDAFNEKAVQRLRTSKKREGKPFAVMFRDIAAVETVSTPNEAEIACLCSPARPIVLLSSHNGTAASVCNGLSSIGAILPSMPFHYLLFEHLKTNAVVLTSGNISDEPIVITDSEAVERLGPMVDAVVSYNRAVHNRVDDSVMMVVNGSPRPIRRSRGYAPGPIPLFTNVEGILAVGAELKHTFCLGKGQEAILSQHIGDLKNGETLEFFEEAVQRFSRLFRFEPRVIACDLHPDYLSTRFALQFGLPLVQVQHHHAHIVACMAEHNLHEQVIGVSFDGTGYGSDETIWGGEFFVADRAEFRRVAHLPAIPLPGGDLVVAEPWRTALALLYREYGSLAFEMDLPFLRGIPEVRRAAVRTSLEKNLYCPLSSSAGRLFDAVAALVGICSHAQFDAEGPMRLESIAAPGAHPPYPFRLDAADGTATPETILDIGLSDTIGALLEDMQSGQDLRLISARFHTTISELIVQTSIHLRSSLSLNSVVLSGGLFQNRYILAQTEFLLEQQGFSVYAHKRVPTNDGGIALGQLAAAAARSELCV